jgi:hypothetical protein
MMLTRSPGELPFRTARTLFPGRGRPLDGAVVGETAGVAGARVQSGGS